MWIEAIVAGVGVWLLAKKKPVGDLGASPVEPGASVAAPSTAPAPSVGKQGTPLAGTTNAPTVQTPSAPSTPSAATPSPPPPASPAPASAAGAASSLSVTTKTPSTASTLAVAVTTLVQSIAVDKSAALLAANPTKPVGWWYATAPDTAAIATAAIVDLIKSYRTKWLSWGTTKTVPPIPTDYPFSPPILSGQATREQLIAAEKAARNAFEIAYNAYQGRTLATEIGSARLGAK